MDSVRFIALCLTLLCALPAQADPNQPLDQALQRLQLTPSQREEVVPLLRAGIQQRHAILHQYGFRFDAPPPELSDQQQRQLRQALREADAELIDHLESVLSSAQLAEFERIRSEYRQQRRTEH
ncbi:hypothetical protein [Ferrimonas marina]|uniref:LTXXQ motif family protein n=1 Tax=Ferrimonas marina TaxID=299255 RepID=A0A1M5ZPV2_9GAMM|nr:hypothetical protein [Ferrimonas marina]SHI26250.1 hypothetical protein SAMN02745129_0463 [Ferrimonas marina]